MDWSLLRKEVLNWRSSFTWRGCLTPLLLGFAPSLWDVLSDYDYAATWPDHKELTDKNVLPRGYLYLFIYACQRLCCYSLNFADKLTGS